MEIAQTPVFFLVLLPELVIRCQLMHVDHEIALFTVLLQQFDVTKHLDEMQIGQNLFGIISGVQRVECCKESIRMRLAYGYTRRIRFSPDRM